VPPAEPAPRVLALSEPQRRPLTDSVPGAKAAAAAGTTPAAAAAELADVHVELGGRAVLAGVTLRVARGEAIALVGPSGAGKTTLLRVLGGALLPTRGRAVLGGVDLGAVDERARRAARTKVGFVPQDHSLVPMLRVSQNVLAGRLGRYGFLAGLRSVVLPRQDELVALHRVLERVGIEEKLFQRTDTLSGGQQQRVAIARALYQEPDLLLADEPVASVDPARARHIVRLLTELAAENGLALVASLHDLALARDHFPRVVGLRDGLAVFDGPPEALTTDVAGELYRLTSDDPAGDVGSDLE
jgi:phosphonate transport system ATP-binding protein